MSFFNVLPKPPGLTGGESRSQIEKNNYRDEQKISYKFLNYDVTLDNLDFVSRDLTMPFDILNYIGRSNLANTETNDSHRKGK